MASRGVTGLTRCGMLRDQVCTVRRSSGASKLLFVEPLSPPLPPAPSFPETACCPAITWIPEPAPSNVGRRIERSTRAARGFSLRARSSIAKYKFHRHAGLMFSLSIFIRLTACAARSPPAASAAAVAVAVVVAAVTMSRRATRSYVSCITATPHAKCEKRDSPNSIRGSNYSWHRRTATSTARKVATLIPPHMRLHNVKVAS